VGGGGGGVVGLCWRPYIAGLLHSVCDQIQECSKLLDLAKKKLKQKQLSQSPSPGYF